MFGSFGTHVTKKVSNQ